MRTLLALDQGTTSTRAILFSETGDVLSVQQKELRLTYPHKGWVEQDARDIWADSLEVLQQIYQQGGETVTAVAALGISNQRETTIVWNKNTGEPVYNAIVWQDRRTAKHCAELKAQGHEVMITAKTGLLLDPYFSATKLHWILDNIEGAREAAEAGDLLFGTVDCFLLWKLTGGKVHVSDVTNASRTMLYNIVEQDWDAELLELFGVPRSMLPDLSDNVADFGFVESALLPDGPEGGLKIGGMAGDQQAALIGQGCFAPGMVKSTYGTGCFALMNIGQEFKVSEDQLLTTAAYRLDGQIYYAVEGAIFVAGAVVQWLRDGLGVITHAADTQALALSVQDNNGVYFVPAFTGLGAPYWRPDVQACISGLTRESTRAHIARAALEAQGYQTLDLLEAMRSDSGHDAAVIRVDGGLVENEFVCQFLADMLRVRIEVPEVMEATAWGAAALAGVSAGVFASLEDVGAQWKAARTYEPQMDMAQRDVMYAGWKEAVERLL